MAFAQTTALRAPCPGVVSRTVTRSSVRSVRALTPRNLTSSSLQKRQLARGLQTRSHQSNPIMCNAATSTVQELQKKFGIENNVEIVEGKGGLPKVVLKHSCGASAEVYLFGGCVTSWKQANGSEVLYVRPDAKFDRSKAISGGIPICFPQFGPGNLPQHGFARGSEWAIASTSADLQPDERDPEVELVFEGTPESKEIYPHPFKVAYSISLHGEQLNTEFRVINTGETAMEFTGALHTYFEVVDVEKAQVSGLKGLEYLDKVPNADNPVGMKLENEVLEFKGPVDSVFRNVPGYCELAVGTGAAVGISFTGWEDVVCWTPWTTMPDCYKEFVCVENAKFGSTQVAPGESWKGTTNFQVVDL